MMEAGTISETLDCNAILTWPIVQEDFNAFNDHESLKSYIYHSYYSTVAAAVIVIVDIVFGHITIFVTFPGCRSRK
jgi:hypothetical protein